MRYSTDVPSREPYTQQGRVRFCRADGLYAVTLDRRTVPAYSGRVVALGDVVQVEGSSALGVGRIV